MCDREDFSSYTSFLSAIIKAPTNKETTWEAACREIQDLLEEGEEREQPVVKKEVYFVKDPCLCQPPLPQRPDKLTPLDYLTTFLFPTVLPALSDAILLGQHNRCFNHKICRQDLLDQVSEFLYNQNPLKPNRPYTNIFDTDFAKAWLKLHPRPILPRWFAWSEDYAATLIQSFFRAYKVRIRPEVQEMRQFWKAIRAERDALIKQQMDSKTDPLAKLNYASNNYNCGDTTTDDYCSSDCCDCDCQM